MNILIKEKSMVNNPRFLSKKVGKEQTKFKKKRRIKTIKN